MRAKRRPLAFTLVEVLVVAAILGVLAALALGAYPRAVQRARSAQCVRNLSELQKELFLYAQDHNGWLPSAMGNTPPPGTSLTSWMAVLAAFMNDPGQTPVIGKATIFRCPAAAATYPEGASRTYAMNVEGATYNDACPLSRLTRPQRTLFLVDSVNATGGDGIQYFRASSFAATVEARHAGRFNGAFLDGHVESLQAADPAIPGYITNFRQ